MAEGENPGSNILWRNRGLLHFADLRAAAVVARPDGDCHIFIHETVLAVDDKFCGFEAADFGGVRREFSGLVRSCRMTPCFVKGGELPMQ